MWSLRLVHELYTQGGRAVFITLTYDSGHLPFSSTTGRPTLYHVHVQKWFKSLRARLGHTGDRQIKFFMCGEYGTLRKRPHYHVILYNLTYNEYISIMEPNKLYLKDSPNAFMCRFWPYGYIDIDDRPVTADALFYVANYTSKKICGKIGNEYYEKLGVKPPYQLMSQGIGKQWCMDNAEVITNELFITNGYYKCSIPRYYADLLGIDRSKKYREFITRHKNDLINDVEKKLGESAFCTDYKGTLSYVEHKNYLASQLALAHAEGRNSDCARYTNLFKAHCEQETRMWDSGSRLLTHAAHRYIVSLRQQSNANISAKYRNSRSDL